MTASSHWRTTHLAGLEMVRRSSAGWRAGLTSSSVVTSMSRARCRRRGVEGGGSSMSHPARSTRSLLPVRFPSASPSTSEPCYPGPSGKLQLRVWPFIFTKRNEFRPDSDHLREPGKYYAPHDLEAPVPTGVNHPREPGVRTEREEPPDEPVHIPRPVGGEARGVGLRLWVPVMAVLLPIALAGSGNLPWRKTAQALTGGHIDSPVHVKPEVRKTMAGGSGSQPEQVGPVRPPVSPGIGLPAEVKGRESSTESSQPPKSAVSGSRERGLRRKQQESQPPPEAGSGSESHPEQPQENQRVTSTTAGGSASQPREATASAQDEDHSLGSEARPPRAPVFYGAIKDDTTGEAYAGAEVQLVGTNCITRTDEYGNFMFKECDPTRTSLLKNPMIRVRVAGAIGWCNEIPLLPSPAITSVNIRASCEGAKFSERRGSIWPQGTQLQGSVVASTRLGDVDLIGSTLCGMTADTRFVGTLSTGVPVELAVTQSELDASDPTGETVLYTVLMKRPGGDTWESACSSDGMQDPRAIAVAGIWNATGAHVEKPGSFTFACVSGVIAKCVRWGYRPWQQVNGISLKDYHQACTRMARADYCGDGVSHTREGTTVAVFDNLGGSEEALAQGMRFEAVWTVDGAICMRRPRWREPVTAIVGSRPSAIRCEDRLRKLRSDSSDMEDSSCRLNRPSGTGHPALIWNYSYVNSSAP